MLSERDIELAHPEAFDFVFGNLIPARRPEFDRHLAGCRYCQGVVDEYGDIGRTIKSLPPHVEPPANLEDRTVTAMVAALAEQRAKTGRRSDAEDRSATRAYPIPDVHPAEPETQVQPRPQLQPLAEDDTRLRPPPADQPAPTGTQARPMITRLPAWRRYRGRLAAVVAAAAAIITAAIVIPLSLGGGRITPAQATVVIPLHATAAAKVSGYGSATGRATAHQDASGSWDITLTVHGLKNFGDSQWYECWYISPQHRQVATAGTFLVPDSGSGTFSMTSAVDPRDFPTMEITIAPPSDNGALAGTVILSGQRL
jgi:Anti-sigma-K factor rskA, C-terminal